MMENILISGTEHPGLLALHSETVWPEFILHDIVGEKYWEALYEKFPAFQFALMEGDQVIGTGNSIPLCLDPVGTGLDDRGWDWALEKGFRDMEQGLKPNVLCGLQIGVGSACRGKGGSARLIGGMREVAVKHGMNRLVLPLRPTQKHRYPLVAMEDYIRWQTPEGLPYDPWLRAHIRFGAEIISVCPKAMYIPGSIAEWESWTGLSLQSSGEYVFSGGLVPLRVDVERGRAEYVEPNVWVEHRI